jgi:hypothetical protein
MPRNHGSFPDPGKVAFLLIDVINDFDFPDSSALLEQAIPNGEAAGRLEARAKKNRIPRSTLMTTLRSGSQTFGTSSVITRIKETRGA